MFGARKKPIAASLATYQHETGHGAVQDTGLPDHISHREHSEFLGTDTRGGAALCATRHIYSHSIDLRKALRGSPEEAANIASGAAPACAGQLRLPVQSVLGASDRPKMALSSGMFQLKKVGFAM